MDAINIHQRELAATPEDAGALLDSLASDEDALWPRRCWPWMELDRALGIGAAGGHGPIRYVVEEYVAGRSVRFRFTQPAGFDGYHGFEVVAAANGKVVLRNRLQMNAHGLARWSWPLVFGPLHDALMEDCLAVAEASLGLTMRVRPWSRWVWLLRWALTGGKARAGDYLS